MIYADIEHTHPNAWPRGTTETTTHRHPLMPERLDYMGLHAHLDRGLNRTREAFYDGTDRDGQADAHRYADSGSHRVTLAEYETCPTCRGHYDRLRGDQARAHARAQAWEDEQG